MGKRYDREFKVEAVRPASEPGNTQAKIERDLGIGHGVISRWKREWLNNGEKALPGKGCLKAGDEGVWRLKCENRRFDICRSHSVLRSTYYNH